LNAGKTVAGKRYVAPAWKKNKTWNISYKSLIRGVNLKCKLITLSDCMETMHAASTHAFSLILFALTAFFTSCDNNNRGELQGYIEGDFVYVSAGISGKILKLHAIKGQKIKSGDLLFELDPEAETAAYREVENRLMSAKARLEDLKKGQRPSELNAMEAALDQAKAARSLAEKELGRSERLLKEGVINQEQLDVARTTFEKEKAAVEELTARLKTARLGAREDQIEAARNEVDAAQAALDQTAWTLSQTKIAADHDAVVVDTIHYEGEWIQPGAPVYSILPHGHVKARFFIPEPQLGAVHIGQKVAVAVDGAGKPLIGKISFISPYAEYTPPVIYSDDNREKLVFMARPDSPPKTP